MKKIILAAIILCASLSAYTVAKANGATAILFTVAPESYVVTSAALDPDFQYSPLNSVFNPESDKLLIARVDHKTYRTASFINKQGYDVVLGFDEYQDVRFRYYPGVRAFVGRTNENEVVVLLEKTSRTEMKKPKPRIDVDCPDVSPASSFL